MHHRVVATLAALALLTGAASPQFTKSILHIGGADLKKSVASAGDVNADGVPDAIVGNYWAFLGGGSAKVYSGTDGSVLFSTSTGWDPVYSNAWLPGASVAGVGDLNGDG